MADKYDAVVIGSGPNGLAAAIALARAGCSLLVCEANATIGGGARSAELTLPGFTHDVCSAVHPLAAGLPFFKTLPLERFGLTCWPLCGTCAERQISSQRAYHKYITQSDTQLKDLAFRRIARSFVIESASARP